MMPAKPNENFSRLADASTQVEEEELQALAQQAMAENLTPQETEAIYARLQGESTPQLAQVPTPQQSEEASPHVLAPQATAASPAPQETEAINALSQGESMQRMTQTHHPVDKTTELLQRFKDIASQQGLSSQNIEWVSEQIHRWNSQKQRQQFLEDTLERGKNSSTPKNNLFYNEEKEIRLLKHLDSGVAAYFEDIQNAEANDEYVNKVTYSAHKMDKALGEIEFRQKLLAPDLENKKELVKDAEAERRNDLQKEMKLTMKRVGECAALQAQQTDLPPYHRHALITLRRQQDELQRLQAPWPEAQPGLSTAVEAQPRPSTKAKTRPGPSLER